MALCEFVKQPDGSCMCMQCGFVFRKELQLDCSKVRKFCGAGPLNVHASVRQVRRMNEDAAVTGIATPPVYLQQQSVITAIVTTYKRPDSLLRLTDSLKQYAPRLPVIIQDTEGNLSRGRNQAVAKVTTPYFLLLEDDFEFTAETQLDPLLEILLQDSEIAIAGGCVEEADRPEWHHCFLPFRNEQRAVPSNLPWRFTRIGIPYRPCHLIQNFGLVRTEAARAIPWDEDLPLSEHREWFWRLHKQWLAAYCPAVSIRHHVDRPTEQYTKDRQRAAKYQKVAAEKMAMHLPAVVRTKTRERPNIILMGVGHSNTTITARQLFAMGWNQHDADEEFAESVSVRRINEAIVQGSQKSGCMDSCIEKFREPWAVKDPRFCVTLHRWLSVLAPYEPLLIWLQKDMEVVRESYRRRKQNPDVVDRRLLQAARMFRLWPWSRMTLQAEQVAAAAMLFDPTTILTDATKEPPGDD